MRPLTIFYLLVFYVVAQLCWWATLLINLQPSRWVMIVGEAFVFLSLLSLGAYKLHKAINQEKARNQQQKNFLLSVTHELKSPLASIKLYLQTILKRDLNPEKKRAFLENSLKDIERLDDLVENMLMATKIENRSYTYPKENFDLSELVRQACERIQYNVCDQQRVLLHIEDNVYLHGDKFAISIVVTNLIENAIKYSDECSEIQVRLQHTAEQIVLSVADQGWGIPDKEKQLIFNKFYRIGDEETRKAKGTGLGLFIVKQVLDNHRATIEVKNNLPKGTIFEVVFNQHGQQ